LKSLLAGGTTVRKSRVLAAAIAAAVVMMTSGVSLAERPPDPARQPDGTYVIASAEERGVVQTRLPVTSHSDVRRGSQGSLPLLFVGSLLLGLGAAVRRST
jgi:hypothetical protein